MLSSTEIKELKEIFMLVDQDGSGSITPDELADLMDTLGLDATPEELREMMKELDDDDSGTIEFEEFVQVMGKRISANYTVDMMLGSFRSFETSKAEVGEEGKLEVADLITALTQYGTKKLTREEATMLVMQMEPDINNKVNYVDYVHMMMRD